jgi:hypothetical protein
MGSGCSCASAANAPLDFPTWEFQDEGVYRQFDNWAVDATFKVRHIFYQPLRDEAEATKLINWAARNGYRVRPTGTQHNWSPLTVGQQSSEHGDKVILTDMRRHFNRVIGIHRSDGVASVTFQPGMTLGDFLAALDREGLSLPHTPAPYEITMGGLLSINGHGTAISSAFEPGDNFGTMSHRLVRIRAATYNAATGLYEFKNYRRAAAIGSPEQQRFSALQTSLGRAFVSEFQIQCEPNYYMRCQSFMNIKDVVMFSEPCESIAEATAEAHRRRGNFAALQQARKAARATTTSMAAAVLASGRAEAIWFPFTETPWLKVWSVCPPTGPADTRQDLRAHLQNALGCKSDAAVLSRRIYESCPFAFADNLPRFATLFFSKLLHVDTDSDLTAWFGAVRSYRQYVADEEDRAERKRDQLDVAAAIKAAGPQPRDPLVAAACARTAAAQCVHENGSIVPAAAAPGSIDEMAAMRRLTDHRRAANAKGTEAAPVDPMAQKETVSATPEVAMPPASRYQLGGRKPGAASSDDDEDDDPNTDAEAKRVLRRALLTAARHDELASGMPISILKFVASTIGSIDFNNGFGGPELTPALGKLLGAVTATELERGGLLDVWGAAKDTLIYVRTNTLRVTANGYAVMMHRRNLERGIYEFVRIYRKLADEFKARNLYPGNCPLEIRVTGLDTPEGLHQHFTGTPGQEPAITDRALGPFVSPSISALHVDAEARDYGYDIVLWLDVLSLPGTHGAAEYYAQMELEMLACPAFQAPLGRVRPEWSKGWGYTADKGAWSSGSFLQHTKATLPKWNEAVAAWGALDPKRVFGNYALDAITSPV